MQLIETTERGFTFRIHSEAGDIVFSNLKPVIVIEGQMVHLGRPDEVVPSPGEMLLRWKRAGLATPLSFELQVRMGATPQERIFTGRVRNEGNIPVRLDFLQPLRLDFESGGCLQLGDDTRRLKMLVMTEGAAGYGTRVENLQTDLRDAEYVSIDRSQGVLSHGVTALHVPSTGQTLVAGLLDFSHQAGTFSVLHGNPFGGPGAQIRQFTVELEHLKPLRPGETVELAPVWLATGRDPHELLERYAGRVRETMRIAPRTNVPCGWISWYAYRVGLSEKLTRANAAVIRRTMFPLGGTLCHFDLGWNAGDRPGDWLEGNDRFPGGVDKLCRELATEGFQVALWSTPLVISEKSRVAREHPEWLLRDANGQPVRFGEWFWPPREMCYCLDPTLTAVQEYVCHVYRTLRSWGVTSFKLDFSGAFDRGLGHTNAPNAARLPIPYAHCDHTRLEACRNLYGIIREAIGDAHLMLCNMPWQGAIGITDSLYLANDIANLTDSESQDERPARRGWDYFRERSRQVFTRYFFHGRTWWSNPDCFVAENDAAENHARARLQVVMLAGGQYKCSNQLPAWKSSRMEAFLKGLPRYGRAARPVDLFQAEYPSVLDLPVDTAWDSWHVVGLFNWQSKKAATGFNLSQLCPCAMGEQLVWDFWEQRFIGVSRDRVELTMPPESAALLCVRPRADHPVLLATDLHFTSGGMEIPHCAWDEKNRVIYGRARRAPGAAGQLFFYLPKGFQHVQAVSVEGGAVLSLPVHFNRSEIEWSVTFDL